jgi:hypothetical protein
METTDNIIPVPERPQALKTLCILSFIGCGLLFCLSLLNIPNIFKSNEAKAMEVAKIREVSESLADQIEAQYMDPSYKSKLITKTLVDEVFLLLTFAGVLMMWKLKKTGFYIYTASEVLYYFSGFISGQGDPSKIMNSLPGFLKGAAVALFILCIIQDLLFIFLYWRQTKHMR